MSRLDITPTPTSEEAAAIMAVLEMKVKEQNQHSRESRWKLSGRDYRGPSTSLRYARDDNGWMPVSGDAQNRKDFSR